MRFSIFYLLSSIIILSSCRGISYNKEGAGLPTFHTLFPEIPTPPELINEPIKEIRFDVWYQPQYTEKEKNRIMTEYKYCFINDPTKDHKMICKRSKARIKQDLVRFDIKSYCYGIKPDKESVFNTNLKARLYDKKGNRLAEDYLRCDRYLDKTKTCHTYDQPSLNFYLPYSKKAYKVKVVKKENEEEIILNEMKLFSHEEIINSKIYRKGINCHSIRVGPIY